MRKLPCILLPFTFLLLLHNAHGQGGLFAGIRPVRIQGFGATGGLQNGQSQVPQTQSTENSAATASMQGAPQFPIGNQQLRTVTVPVVGTMPQRAQGPSAIFGMGAQDSFNPPGRRNAQSTTAQQRMSPFGGEQLNPLFGGQFQQPVMPPFFPPAFGMTPVQGAAQQQATVPATVDQPQQINFPRTLPAQALRGMQMAAVARTPGFPTRFGEFVPNYQVIEVLQTQPTQIGQPQAQPVSNGMQQMQAARPSQTTLLAAGAQTTPISGSPAIPALQVFLGIPRVVPLAGQQRQQSTAVPQLQMTVRGSQAVTRQGQPPVQQPQVFLTTVASGRQIPQQFGGPSSPFGSQGMTQQMMPPMFSGGIQGPVMIPNMMPPSMSGLPPQQTRQQTGQQRNQGIPQFSGQGVMQAQQPQQVPQGQQTPRQTQQTQPTQGMPQMGMPPIGSSAMRNGLSPMGMPSMGMPPMGMMPPMGVMPPMGMLPIGMSSTGTPQAAGFSGFNAQSGMQAPGQQSVPQSPSQQGGTTPGQTPAFGAPQRALPNAMPNGMQNGMPRSAMMPRMQGGMPGRFPMPGMFGGNVPPPGLFGGMPGPIPQQGGIQQSGPSMPSMPNSPPPTNSNSDQTAPNAQQSGGQAPSAAIPVLGGPFGGNPFAAVPGGLGGNPFSAPPGSSPFGLPPLPDSRPGSLPSSPNSQTGSNSPSQDIPSQPMIPLPGSQTSNSDSSIGLQLPGSSSSSTSGGSSSTDQSSAPVPTADTEPVRVPSFPGSSGGQTTTTTLAPPAGSTSPDEAEWLSF